MNSKVFNLNLTKEKLAVISLVLGILNIIAAATLELKYSPKIVYEAVFIYLTFIPITVIGGLVLAIRGLRSRNRMVAIVGIILNVGFAVGVLFPAVLFFVSLL